MSDSRDDFREFEEFVLDLAIVWPPRVLYDKFLGRLWVSNVPASGYLAQEGVMRSGYLLYSGIGLEPSTRACCRQRPLRFPSPDNGPLNAVFCT